MEQWQEAQFLYYRQTEDAYESICLRLLGKSLGIIISILDEGAYISCFIGLALMEFQIKKEQTGLK